jgi:hypothetical protein
MTVLALITFKRLYEELEFVEDVENEVLNFFEYFTEIFNMPASPHIRGYCAMKLDLYLSGELCELETIKQILSIIKTYNKNPLDTKQYVKKYLLKTMYGGDPNETV